jgi:hypothetical protein
MFTSTLRNPSLILAAVLAAMALTTGSASAQRGGGGSRGGAGVHVGVMGSAAVGVAPTLQATPMRLPQLSTRSPGVVASTGSRAAVLRAPNSADPPASKAGAVLFLLNFLSAPPTPTPSAPAAPPMPAFAAPEGQIQPIAPLALPDTLTTFGTGRPSVSATTVSPYFSYSAPESPSQVAPSLPGGGGGTLKDCMAFWDRATHMTKIEWKAACQRTLHRLDDVAREFERKPTPAKPSD